MKKLILALIIVFNTNLVQSQNWLDLVKPEIIKNGTGYSSSDQSYGIYEDASGNLYHTGYFDGEINFGNTTLQSIGNRDIFIAKINKNGGWDWAVSAGGASTDFSRDITCDNSGNIFITGYFYGTCYFGNNSVTATSNSDIYIAKLSSSGQWLWAKSANGNGFNRGSSVSCDNSGNCYITGSYESSINFGNITLSSSGLRDIFVAKISPSGNYIWAVSAGGTGQDESNAIKYYTTNSFAIITGYFANNPAFGQTTLISAGGRDLYVARIDSNGTWNWAVSAGTTNSEESRAVAIDVSGNALITGFYKSAISFGGNNLPAGDGKDVFVAKISKTGSWIWAKNATGTNDDEANSIGLDNSGNAYITGNFYEKVSFGSTELTAISDRNGFVAKISSAGSWVWGTLFSGTSTIDGTGIWVSSNGISYISGSFYQDVNFGSTSFNTKGESDFYVARLTSGGNWTWGQTNGGVTGLATGEGVSIDYSGNVIYTGSFYGSIKFGSTTLVSNGKSDIYLAKYSPDNGWLWAKSFGGTADDLGKAIAIDTNRNIYLTGQYEQDVDFGIFNLTSNGAIDAFITKLDSNGACLWANSIGDIENDYGVEVTHKGDYIVISGVYSKRPYFGLTRLTNKGNDDIYLSKLDLNGNYLWAVSAGSSQYETLNDLYIDIDDNILITGGFESTCYFGNSVTTQSVGGDDAFVARANSSGSWLWAISAGTSNFQEAGWGVASDNNKNVYITGNYRGFALFGNEYLLAYGQSDIFVSKIDSSGNWIWSKGIGGVGSDFVYSLKFMNQSITIGGYVTETFTTDQNQFISNGISRNSFIANLNNMGTIQWVRSDANSGYSEIKDIAVSPQSIAFITGNYIQNLKLGNLIISEQNDVDRNAFFAINGVELQKPSWTFSENTGKSSQIKIPISAQPTVNNRELIEGDAIGIFYSRNNNLYCAGMSYYDGDDFEITVWGDDNNTPVKDGYVDNEKYIFKIWDVLKSEEVRYNVRYASGPDNFSDLAYSVVSQIPIKYDTLRIPLTQGWNMVSSHSLPRELNMDSVFSEIRDNIALAKSGLGFNYIPQFDINTIGNWNIYHGYQIYAKQITELVILGDIVNPSNSTFNLTSGWNLISYLRNSPISAVTAFAPLVNQGILVLAKTGDGRTYIPQFDINNIGTLKPGEAFQIYLTNGTTFTYPAND